MDFVISLLLALYVLGKIALAAFEGLVWGVVIGIAAAVVWWAVRREEF